jgi:RNA polymerase sigma-70 factor (ECF subfamily)
VSAEFKDRITQVLQDLRVSKGDNQPATDWLFSVLYDELRSLADRLMRGERTGHTLQPTALVNEAYLKLMGGAGLDWESRAHFLGVCARAMRQVLVDYARRRNALKRSGIKQVTISESVREGVSGSGLPAELEVLALDEALNRLSEQHERMGCVVELKVFAGMKMREIAHVLTVSPRTVASDWSFAKLWLSRELGGAA